MTLFQFLNALMLVLVGASFGVVMWGIRTFGLYHRLAKRPEYVAINLVIAKAFLYRSVFIGMAIGMLVAAVIS